MSWVFSWSLSLVAMPACIFQLALGCCVLYRLFAPVFSVLGMSFFVTQITRCWIGDRRDRDEQNFILPLVISSLIKSLWKRRRVGEEDVGKKKKEGLSLSSQTHFSETPYSRNSSKPLLEGWVDDGVGPMTAICKSHHQMVMTASWPRRDSGTPPPIEGLYKPSSEEGTWAIVIPMRD